MLYLIIFLSIFLQGDCCQSKIETEANYVFYVKNVDQSSCINFRFQYCERTSSSDDGFFYSQNWQQCIQQLCKMNNEPKTYQTLQKCYDNKVNKKLLTKIIIGVSVAFGIIFCVVITIIIFRYCCNPDKVQSEPQQIRQDDSIFMKYYNQYKKQRQAKIMKLNSRELLINQQKIKNENCAICLDINSLSQLQCKHYYHLKCIKEWAKRSNECPICRKTIAIINLQCGKCKINETIIEVIGSDNILETHKYLCGPCRLLQE